jgi:hypothetical protein
MFRRSPKPPTKRPFAHEEGCPIALRDPDFVPEWQLIDEGKWQRSCQCTTETAYERPGVPKIDPYDPATFRHAPQCDYRGETNPSLVRTILSVRPGLEGGYWWVTCGHCQISWPVPNIVQGKGDRRR